MNEFNFKNTVNYLHSNFVRLALSIQATEKIAVIAVNNQLTYGEVLSQVVKISVELKNTINVKAGARIGVICTRDESFVIAILAVLVAGHSFVPLDPEWPESYRDLIIAESNIKIIITNTEDFHFKNNDLKILKYVDLVNQLELIDNSSILNELLESSESAQLPHEKEAYVIFTSGTTGKPKGVRISHFACLNTINWVNNTLQISEKDKLLNISSFCFDLTIYDIFGALSSGASVRIVGNEELKDRRSVATIIEHEGITVWNSAPGLYLVYEDVILNYISRSDSTIRYILLSGDWIPINSAKKIVDMSAKAKLISLGGATETAIWSNYYFVEQVNSDWDSVPYGKAMDGNQYYLLYDDKNPVSVGEPGDLYISGVNLALGYTDKDLTAEAFVDISSNHEVIRAYKTGDVCKLGDDENFIFLGRKNSFEKIRGYRIDLSLIDATMQQNESVQHSVTFTAFENKEKILISFVIAKDTQDSTGGFTNKLKFWLSDKLPAYMVPDTISLVGNFPITANGKVDKAELIKLFLSEREQPADSLDCSALEKEVESIFKVLLKIQSVDNNVSFFDLGGNSLLAVELVDLIEAKYAIVISVIDIFELNTVKEIAKRIANELQSQ